MAVENISTMVSSILIETVGEVSNSMASRTDQEDHHSTTSEQSMDLGEAERERVREVVRDTGRIGSEAQLPGQIEIERVRVVTEWIYDRRYSYLEDQVAEAGSQIERVCQGLGLDSNPFHTSKKRKTRIVGGRQVLVDLLNKNDEEKQRELQGLLESCPVRNFAFRNRIQSVLRIRLLQNSGSAENNRKNTTAESELGFLRQRQTVSGLREGFLSGLQNNVHVQENDHSGNLQNNDSNVSRENETQDNNSAVVVDIERDKVAPANKYSRSGPSSICTEYVSVSEGQIEARLAHVDGNGEETVNDEVTLTTEDNEIGIWEVISSESSGSSDREQIEVEETNQPHSDAGNDELQLHGSLSNPELFESEGINGPEDSSGRDLPAISQEASSHENIEHVQLEEAHEAVHDHHIYGNEDQGPPSTLPHSVELEDPRSEDAHAWESSTQGDEAQEWIDGSSFSELRDRSQPEFDQEEWPDGATTEELSHDNTRESERRDQSQLVESLWHDSGSQQTLENWSPLPLETGALSTARADLYDYSDDDNAHNIEIRELLSRRRVSSLLSSGFRESLDQLIQSYVERQSHTPNDWELHEMLPPPFVVHDQDHVNTNHNEDSSDVDGQTSIPESTFVAVPSNRTWEQQFHDIPWSRDIHQCPGTVLEMINDLRIEMARLQQQLNHMQGMLEACIDVQLELQRSVRQEVSAALNRSINPSELDEAGVSVSSSNWDWVREGNCCICRVGNIDSLLYRCGHMCTCAKCAGVLFEGEGKCPMCQAPVIEVIRAYTLQ